MTMLPLEQARYYVSGLDRACLGRFAVSEHALVYAAAVINVERVHKRGEMTRFGTDSYIQDLNEEYGDGRYAPVSNTKSFGELYFWEQSTDANFLLGAASHMDISEVEAHSAFLDVVSVTTEREHDYLALGITNRNTINRLIEDDIDPAMALAVLHEHP